MAWIIFAYIMTPLTELAHYQTIAMGIVFTKLVCMTMAHQLWIHAIGRLQPSRVTLSDILFLALLPVRDAGTYRSLIRPWLPAQ